MSGYTRDSLLVSWTPPFSLDISHSTPDLWYSLSKATPTGTSLPCSNCHYITESFYNLSLTSVSQGMYEISVVPSNAYGRTNHASRLFVYLVLEYDCNASTSNVTTNISLLVPGMGEYRVNLASIMLHNLITDREGATTALYTTSIALSDILTYSSECEYSSNV